MISLRLARSAVLAFGANLFARAASALVFLLIARLAGPEDAGLFSLGTTYLAIGMALLWGRDELTVREVAREPGSAGRYLTHLFPVRILLSAAFAGALALALRGLQALDAPGYSPHAVAFLTLLALSLLADAVAAIPQSLLIAYRHQGVLLALGLVLFTLRLAGGAWALAAGTGLMGVASVWVVAGAVNMLMSLAATAWYIRPRLVSPWPLAREWWLRTWRQALPFLAISATNMLEYQADVVLLSFWWSKAHLGWYGAAVTIFSTLWLIPQAYRTVLFPEMARLQVQAPAQLARLHEQSMRLMLVISLPVVAGLELLAPQIIRLLFAQNFEPAIPVLRVLSAGLPLLFMNVPATRLLAVHEQQGRLARIVTASLATNLVTNMVLIPAWGIVGAAAARLASTTALWALSYWSARRYVPGFDLVRVAARPVLATAAMAVAVWLLRDAPLGVGVGAGIALYAILAWGWVAEEAERRTIRAAVLRTFRRAEGS